MPQQPPPNLNENDPGLKGFQDLRRNFNDFVERETKNKRAYAVRAKECYYMARNVFHWIADEIRLQMVRDPKLSKGHLKIPRIRRYLDIAASTGMSRKIVFEPTPNTASREDYMRAQAAMAALLDFEQVNPSHTNNIAMFRQVCNLGLAYRRLYTDEDWVPINLPPMSNGVNPAELYEQMSNRKLRKVEPLPSGEFRAYDLRPIVLEENLSPFNMIAQTGAACLDDCTQFVVHRTYPVEYLKLSYPHLAEFIHGEQISDKHMAHDAYGALAPSGSRIAHNQQDGVSFSPDSDVARLFDCWKKVSRTSWVHMTCVSSNFLVADIEEVEFHPYIEYRGSTTGDGDFWPTSMTWDAADSQRALVTSVTDLDKNFSSTMKDIIVAEDRLRSQIGNGFGNIVWRSSRTNDMPITRVDMPTGAHMALLQLVDVWDRHISESFGLSDVSLGRVKSHVPEMGLRLSSQADEGPMSITHEWFVRGERQKSMKYLRMAQEIYDEPRFMSAAGEYGEVFARAVRGKDLWGIAGLRLVDTMELPKDTSGRMELAGRLTQYGLFDEGAEFRLRSFRDFVHMQRGVLPQFSDESIHRANAEKAVMMIQNGEAAFTDMQADPESGQMMPGVVKVLRQGPKFDQPLLQDTDDHYIHAEVITQALVAGQFTPETRQQAVALLAEHQERIGQMEEQQRQSELEVAINQSLASHIGQAMLQGMSDRSSERETNAKLGTQLAMAELKNKGAFKAESLRSMTSVILQQLMSEQAKAQAKMKGVK